MMIIYSARRLAFAVSGILLALFTLNPLTAATPTASITFIEPSGFNDFAGEGQDFATTVLRDPWDMSEPSDILYQAEVPGMTISNGILSFTTSSAQTRFSPLFQGIYGGYSMSQDGTKHPIDTSRFQWLSFRMRLSQSSTAYVHWFYDQTYTKFAVSKPIPVVDNQWHTYVVDLETWGTSGLYGGAIGWDGQPVGLAIQPAFAGGTKVEVDWIRLTASNPTTNTVVISWSNQSPASGTLEFYLDTDNTGYDGTLIHSRTVSSSSGSINWGVETSDKAAPSNFLPGNYYVYAKIGGQQAGYSPAPLTIEAVPILRFTHPSYTSGDDYAATELGNPWDMSEASDIHSVQNGSYSVENGLVKIVNTIGDVQVYPHVGAAIDASKYHYFTYRALLDYPIGISDIGQWLRLFWGPGSSIVAQSELHLLYSGWQIYRADLRQLPLHSGTPWQNGSWDIFRLDPNSNTTGGPMTTYIDYIMLTADPSGTTNSHVPISYELSKTSGVTVTLYYDSDTDPGAKTLMSIYTPPPSTPVGPNFVYLPSVLRRYPPDLPLPSGTRVIWETPGTPGSYYVLAQVTDGHNTAYWYSEVPIILTN